MSEPFSELLRESSEPNWTAATTHEFTEQLGEGTLGDAVFREYLVQDYAFVDALASLVGYGVAQAPRYEAKQRLATFLATIVGDETDYFQRSFEELEVSEGEWHDPEPTAVTREFRDLVYRAGARGGYAETLAVLVPVEWVYATWAGNAPEQRPDAFYLAEWVDLHDNPAFHDTVEWLRSELDQVGDTIGADRQARIEHLFDRAIELEIAFFDDAFAQAGVSLDG